VVTFTLACVICAEQ